MPTFGYFPTSYSHSASPEWVLVLTMVFILLTMLLGGLVFGLGHQGTELSLDNHSYRNYFELLGLRFGRWQQLPSVVGVTIKFHSTMGSSSTSGSGSITWGVWDTSTTHYQKLVILLSLQNSATGLVIEEFKTDALVQARQMAQEVAARFGVPIREYLVPQRTRKR